MSQDVTTQTQSQAPAQRPQPQLMGFLQQMRPEIERALPRHLQGDRFVRIVTTEINKNPMLAQSTPESFFGALLTAAALGLEIGVLGEAYLVPYRNKRAGTVECQLIVGYQGLVDLFWRHPLAKGIDAQAVHENDHFVIKKGLAEDLDYRPAVTNRGKIIGYYAKAELSTGAAIFDFFTPEEIKTLRGGKVGTSGDIADPMRWMERKTALKQVLKLMPKSAELATALRADETIGSMAVGKAIAQGDALPELEYAEAADE